MRATASHRVELKSVLVSGDARLFSTKQYLDELWQPRFIPHFSASLLGAATNAYEFAGAYMKRRGRAGDSIVQHQMAQMRIALDVLETHLVATAQAWSRGDRAAVARKSNICRAVGETQAMEVVHLMVRMCGATALLQSYPLGRILRDLRPTCDTKASTGS